MYAITKEFTFAAGHFLEKLPFEHKCSRLHGHNYSVIVELRSDSLNASDFVLDYDELRHSIGKWLDEHWDHRVLNDVMSVNPSAENMAKVLYRIFKTLFPNLLYSVTVKETDKTTAKYWEE